MSETTNPLSGGVSGEVVAWDVAGVRGTRDQIVAALAAAGLETEAARKLCPRHAWCRAARGLAENRIIRPLSEDGNTLAFQFTREDRAETICGDRYHYDFEAVLSLDKQTGRVTGDSAASPALVDAAQKSLDAAIEARTAGDVTAIVQRLMRKHADLFPIRSQGGCYFVPRHATDFIAKVQQFLQTLGGRMSRFPVAGGTAHGDASVKEAVSEGLARMVGELRAEVETFGNDTKDFVLQRKAERIKLCRFKLEAYADYLAEQRAGLEESLRGVQSLLRQKVAAVAAVKDESAAEPEPVAAVA
jgi:hypothetical protein